MIRAKHTTVKILSWMISIGEWLYQGYRLFEFQPALEADTNIIVFTPTSPNPLRRLQIMQGPHFIHNRSSH